MKHLNKMKHLKIEIRDETNQVIALYDRVRSIDDVKDCLFRRLNQSSFALSCTYLLCYNYECANSMGADNYFEIYTSNRKLFKLESKSGLYTETAYIVEVDK